MPGPAETDADAKFHRGLALLGGETASADGPRGISLIDTAAANGHADALAMSALFEAMGALRPQNWPAAMAKLRRAAELGSESARGQVRVLEERGSPDLSIDRLLAPAPKRQLHDGPRILAYPGFAAKAECEWIIGRARDRLKPAKVFATSTGDQTHNPARDNKAIEFQLPDMDVVLEVLRARISAATRLPVPIFEPTQILHYSVGEQFRPHHDFLDPEVPGFAEHLKKFGQRIATVLIYLNDGYEGGETVFPKLGISHRAAAGDALFFTNVDRSGRGDPLTMHAGSPPTSGEKWVFSQWIRDRLPAQ